MQIAFLISAYKDPLHLRRLVESLPEGADCYIHVDANADIAPFKAVVGKGVTWLDERYKVAWGSFRQVEFQMALLRAALHSGKDYDYLFVLSGQDYPVWSNSRILQFLQANRGRNFLQATDFTLQPRRISRIYTEHRFFNNHCWPNGTLRSKLRVALRKVCAPFLKKRLEFQADGKKWRLYKGADYFAVTAQLARYVVDEWERLGQLKKYFKDSFAPSETFIHTVVFNSRFADSCITTVGEYRGLYTVTPLTFIDYSNGIQVLDESDFQRILQSGKMFCRKVATGKSDRLVELLDEHRAKEGEASTDKDHH